MTGAVKGKGVINLDPESVRTFLETQLHKSATATSANPRHTAQIDGTHIKAIIGNGNDAIAFGKFHSFKINLSNIQIDGDFNTIYILNGFGSNKSPEEKGTLSLTVDQQGAATVKYNVQGIVTELAMPQVKDIPTVTVSLPSLPTTDAASVSPSSSPTISVKRAGSNKENSGSPLKKIRKIFQRASSSNSSSSESETASSSSAPRNRSVSSSVQKSAFDQQLAQELERRNSRQ